MKFLIPEIQDLLLITGSNTLTTFESILRPRKSSGKAFGKVGKIRIDLNIAKKEWLLILEDDPGDLGVHDVLVCLWRIGLRLLVIHHF